MTDTNKILYMQDWAARYNCVLKQKTHVGFNRPAVGIFYGSAFVEIPEDIYLDWTPEDAYHKWESISVLVHEDDYDKALDQLFEWIQWLEEHKFGVEIQRRKTLNTPGSPGATLELLLNGTDQPKLVKLDG